MPTGFAPECMVCLIDKQAQRMPADWSEARRAAYLRDIMRVIVEADPDESGPEVTRRIFALSDASGIPQRDYRPIKARFNRLLLGLAPRLRAEIDAAPDPLARAMQYARAANYIDFEALGDVSEDRLLALLDASSADPLDGEEYAAFRADLGRAQALCYVTDNCGEIVADMLLMERLRALRPGLRITAVVRGGEVANDANLEDARMVGLEAAARVVSNGNTLAGTFLDELAPDAREALETADLVVSKGQANFETLSGCGLNVYYLFLCKCHRFERRFHMDMLSGVLANERRLARLEGRA